MAAQEKKMTAHEIVNGYAIKKNDCAAKKIGCAVILIRLCKEEKYPVIPL
jgi:hypothetical protein